MSKLNYKQFVKIVLQTTEGKITWSQMSFAFTMFYEQFGETPEKAIESVRLLDSFREVI